MPSIHSLHWAEIPVDGAVHTWVPGPGRILVLWPAPIDHDACFAAAGFSDFADSDETWDAEFAGMVGSLVRFLERFGEARLQSGDSAREGGVLAALGRALGARRQELGPANAILVAARDDNIPPCEVHFGVPVRAVLRTSNGHPLLWVWSNASGLVREELLAAIGGHRAMPNTSLDWTMLG